MGGRSARRPGLSLPIGVTALAVGLLASAPLLCRQCAPAAAPGSALLVGAWLAALVLLAAALVLLVLAQRAARGMPRPDDAASSRSAELQGVLDGLPGWAYRSTACLDRPIAQWRVSIGAGQLLRAGNGAGTMSHDLTARDHRLVPVSADAAMYEQRRQQAVQTRTPWDVAFRVLAPDGQTRWLRERGGAAFDARGLVTHIDGYVMDITSQQRGEQHSRLLAQAMERSASEILLLEPDQFKVIYANRGARRNLQLADDGSDNGLSLQQVALGGQDFEQQLRTVAAGGRDELRLRLTMRRCDGTNYPADVVCSLVADDADHSILLVAVDVTESVRLAAALRGSHERNALAVQASRDGLCDVDLVSGTVYVSPLCAAMLGYDSAAQFLAQSAPRTQIDLLLDHIHAADRVRVEALHNAYLERHTDEFDAEFRYRTRTGVYRWLHARGLAVWDGNGIATRYALCLSDITHRKISEAMLQDTVSRLGAVLQHVADGIITLDRDGRIRSFNPAAERVFGWQEEDVLDQSITMLVPLPEAVGSLPLDQAFRAVTGSDACVGVRRDGATIPIEITATRMIVANAEMYTALVRDVSARRNVEIELRRARDTAEAGLRAKSEFLAVMSHEVRTPLNGVLGMAQLLHEMSLTPEQDETVRTIQRSGEALLSIINDLLDFSKIEAGRMQLEHAPFDIGFALREVFELLAPRIREHALEIVVDYAREVPRRVIGDATRLRQILLNLCGNALKFTQTGHVAVTVCAMSRTADMVRLRVTVEDTGIGIAADVQSQLFAPFVQADASTTRRFGGTGLGLAICRQLVELMGGTIAVTSAPGVGSQFAFELSLRVAPDELPAVPATVRRQALLLVPYARTAGVLARDLVELGCSVRRVELLTDVLAADADVLVLDVAACGGDVSEAAAALRECNWLARTLLLVPGSGGAAHAGGKSMGFGGVLAKPWHAHELRAVLDDLTAGARATAAPQRVDRHDAPSVPARDQRRGQDDGPDRDAHAAPDTAAAAVCGCDVLIVEDNHVNQRVARRMLESLGCRVEVASNGREALAAWRQQPFALIFMDVRMPEIDGYQATRTIRTEEQRSGRPPVPIVAMTANAEASDELQCRAAGMSDFLGKPIKVAQLQRVLATWAGWLPARAAGPPAARGSAA